MISRVNLSLRSFMSSKKSAKKPLVTNVTTAAAVTNGPIKFRTDKEGFVQLNLHVKPGAKVSRVAEITEGHIGLQISAPPRDGEANEEVVRYIAEIFKLKERQVSLIAGHKSRDKIVLIEQHGRNLDEINEILINNQD